MPMDDANKQRLDEAKDTFKTRVKIGGDLSLFLNRIANEIDDLDRDKRLTLFRQQIKAHQYMDGNFFGYVDFNCEWQQQQRGTNEVWYTDNQLYPYLRTALMELSRGNPEVLVNAPPGASDELVAAAKFAKSRYDANRERTFNARLKQTENSYALLNGITYRYTFPQFDAGTKERIPTLENGAMEGEGMMDEMSGPSSVKMCAMCSRPAAEPVDMGMESEMGEQTEQKCASCGSDMFVDIEMQHAPAASIGYENLPNAQNAWIVPNPVGVIVSMQATCIEESPFLKWKQMISRAVLQSKFKGLELPSTGTESVELRYITNQQKATPDNTTGTSSGLLDSGYDTDSDRSSTSSGGGRELELLEFQQVWIDYALYCDIKFKDDTSIGRGKTLKAGQPLGELFPEGLYYARCGELIVDMWNENKNRKWTSTPYGIRAGSMYGSGVSAALSDQEVLNEIEALVMANMWSNGVPREFVDPGVIAELSADPQIPTRVDMSGVEGNIMGRAYAMAPATALSPEIYAMKEKHSSSIQNKIGAMSGTGAGGLNDTQQWGNTATAISIKRDLAVGRFSPDLALKADQLDKMQAIQFLENEQQYFTPSQWTKEIGEHGKDALKSFLNCDIKHDLIVTIAEGSYMPKSDAQTQAKLMGYSQLLPVLAQVQNPELIAYAAEVFGIPEHLSGWNSDREYAKKVIKRFEGLAEMFVEQFGDVQTNDLDDPMVAEVAMRINDYAKMPVDAFLDNHEALQDAYKDWRTTDSGQLAPNVMLAAVALRVNLHQEGIVKQGQMLTRTQQAVQEPLKEEMEADQAKQLEAENQAGAAQQQAAEEEAQVQMETQGANTIMDHADRDDARTHEKEMQDAKHSHEKDIEAAKMMTTALAAEQKAKSSSASK